MSDIVKYFLNIVHALNPRIADTPDQIFAWRQTVAVILVLLTLVTGFQVSQARGWMGWAALPGYVTEAELRGVEQMVRQTREDQLVQQILDNTRRYCQSYEAGDTQGMQFAFQSLQEIRTKYFQLTKRDYPQLMCSMSAQPAKPTTN